MSISIFRTSASVAAIALSVCIAGTAEAQTRTFNIPQQPASSGVRVFAQQAGIQVIVSTRDAEGKSTNAVRGALEPRAALEQLLSGTGLVIRSFDGRVAILAADSAYAGDTVESIVVTGTRIARPDLTSSMPLSVIAMDNAYRMGRTTAYDALMREPGVAVGSGLANAYGASWDGGVSSVSLRNLGTNRSLTLVDGMRRVSGSARSSAVDLNMIPSAMIERIEVITGGAAAIYGADAVTGAVNIITRRHFDGIELTAQGGVSDYGDSEKFTASVVTGTSFAEGRGSITVGGVYSTTPELTSAQRPFGQNLPLYLANPKNTGPNDGIPDQVIIPDYRQMYYSFTPSFFHAGQRYMVENGVPRQARYDVPWTTGEFSTGEGGDGRNLFDINRIHGALDTFAVIGRLDYDLTDSIVYTGRIDYGQTDFTGAVTTYRDDSRKTSLNGAGGPVVRLDHAYLPAAVRQYMIDNRLTSINVDRAYGSFPLRRELHDRKTVNLFSGLKGDLGERLNWEAYFQYGRSTDDVRTTNTPVLNNWLAARDAIIDPVTNTPVCRDPAARAAGCVPFDIFGMEPATEAQRNYALATRAENRTNTQRIFGASIGGRAVSLPDGDVSMVLGIEHRREALKTTDDPLGLNGQITFSGSGQAAHPEIDEAFDVAEIYTEVVVPILADRPFARRLEIEGAYRYSDYSTIGGTDTWKIAGTWSPIRDLSFRSVRSRSVRTANFGELYQPQVDSINATLPDPCSEGYYYQTPTRSANCAALGMTAPIPLYKDGILITTGGNPDLRPETSDSLTFGVVIQPRFAPGLNIVADYWDIEIEDVISQFNTTQVMNLCVDLPSVDNVFCRQISRYPDGKLEHISSYQINAARLMARGVDFGVDYRRPVGPGELGVSLKATYLIEQMTETTPGQPAGNIIYDDSYSNPTFKGALALNYELGDLSIALDTRYIDASQYDPNARSDEYYSVNTVPSRTYNDISIQYRFKHDVTVSLGVNNLFNVEPPFMPSISTGGGGLYDNIGRYFFLSAKVRM